MAYDSPKAIHFIAFFKGKKMSNRDPVGLRFRWAMASRVSQGGVENLINLSSHDLKTIKAICKQVNVGRDLTVEYEEQTDVVHDKNDV